MSSLAGRFELAAIEAIRRALGESLPGAHRSVCRFAVKGLPRHIDVELFRGVHVPLDLEQSVQRMSWWAGRRFEAPTVPFLQSWSAGATKFFDIGANYGFYAYFAAAHSPADIYAFEPNPTLHRLMLDVKRRNQMPRFHPQPLGLSDEPGTLPLHVCDTDLGWSTFGEHPDQWPVGAVAAITTFDSWLLEHHVTLPGHPEWVAKIDVEGFELRVLRGMKHALEARAFVGIALELNEFTLQFCGATTAEAMTLLAGAGYREVTSKTRRNKSLNRFFVPS